MTERRPILIVASGDSRPSANRRCWPAQQALEAAVGAAMTELGRETRRAHAPDDELTTTARLVEELAALKAADVQALAAALFDPAQHIDVVTLLG